MAKNVTQPYPKYERGKRSNVPMPMAPSLLAPAPVPLWLLKEGQI